MIESTQELASRWQRLWGSLIDALIGVAVVFPAMWFSGVLQQLYRGEAMSLAQRIVWFAFGTVVFIVIQGHLLGKHGQTIGKRMVGTRIVSCEDGRILPFWTVFPLRYLSVSLVSQIPVAGQWLSPIDVLFIFRKDKRCIHDLIARTKVVKANKQDATVIASSSKPTDMNDDALYDEVAKEMRENRMVPGVWTRAFAEADGDENRAKAIYIKLRVAHLSDRERGAEESKRCETLQKNQAGIFDCPCGFSGKAKVKPRGNLFVAFLLFCFYIIPGIIYVAIRSGYKAVCPSCGKILERKFKLTQGLKNQRASEEAKGCLRSFIICMVTILVGSLLIGIFGLILFQCSM